jgi:hypothetical protein
MVVTPAPVMRFTPAGRTMMPAIGRRGDRRLDRSAETMQQIPP